MVAGRILWVSMAELEMGILIIMSGEERTGLAVITDGLRMVTRKGRQKVYLSKLADNLRAEWVDFRPVAAEALGEAYSEVECRRCPKFASFPARCTVPWGKLRSCIVASIEYHLRDLRGKRVLELGCGESSHARAVIEAVGGNWVGLDQRAGKGKNPSVRSIAASVPDLPFRDESFDVVVGIQTIEHWEDVLRPGEVDYETAMAQVWRVLKPGGWTYFDCPIHLHGAPAFIRGDLAAIRAIYGTQDWRDVRFLTWRRKHEPLAARFAPERESSRWNRLLADESPEEIEQLKPQASWILAIRADKPLEA